MIAWPWLLVVFVVGVLLGVLVLALCVAAGEGEGEADDSAARA